MNGNAVASQAEIGGACLCRRGPDLAALFASYVYYRHLDGGSRTSPCCSSDLSFRRSPCWYSQHRRT